MSVTTIESESFVTRIGRWPAMVKDYVGELQMEMRRVSWPSWKQVRATTGVVIAAVFAFAAYFYVVDLIVGRAITKVFTALSSRAAMADQENVEEQEPIASKGVPPAEMPADEAAAEAGMPDAVEGEVETAAPVAVDVDASPKNWFIIHTYSGFEQKVAESLRSRAEAFGYSDKIGQVLIPTEEVVSSRRQEVDQPRLLYPGYVLVEIEMSDELWHAVKATPRVTGFVGGGTKPVPLSADEVNQILYRQASSAERPRPKLSFEKSEMVRIIEGPFANFSGKDEVNANAAARW
jgi:transcriptional antiterminator NusG